MTQYRPSREEFRRALWRASLPPLLLLAALAAFVSLLLFQLLRANTGERQSAEIIARTHGLDRLLANMESGVRGYLLSGSDEFLDPYNKARAQIEPAIADMQSRLANPTQRDRLNALHDGLNKWLALEPQLRSSKLVPIAPETLAVLRQRKQLMDDMRLRLTEMVISESQQQHDLYEDFQRASMLAVLGSIGVSMSLGIGLALINRRTIMRLTGVYQRALDAEDARAADLASSNQQFLDLAEAIPQLVWISDEKGKPVYFNSPWAPFTGSTLEQLSEHGWSHVLHPEDHAQATSRWQESLRNSQPFEAEYRLKQQADGGYRWFLCRAMPVRDKSGKSIRWFGSCTDIHNQKQMEQDREQLLAAERQARSDLLRSSTIKDQFLATLSHELRTPMTAILGWTQLLHDPVIRDKSLDRAIESIDSNARAQAKLIEDLLDMSRILSGKLTIRPEAMDLRRTVQLAIEAARPALLARQLTLSEELSPADDLQMAGDPARLQQVVWNLLSNAVKFTPVGGNVAISLRREGKGVAGDEAIIVVADSGRGILPEFLPHVFERFRQADGSTTRQHGGLGLGLAIVKHLVEMHGGTVEAASKGEGRGATFTVRLPIRASVAVPVPAESARPAVPAESLVGMQVLLVEDDVDASEVLRTILERAGAIVHTASSGALALMRLRESPFDLLISDIGMPEMDGYGLIRRVREMEAGGKRRMPAIALTAFAQKEDRLQALSAGYDLHLSKPVVPDELIRAAANLSGAN